MAVKDDSLGSTLQKLYNPPMPTGPGVGEETIGNLYNILMGGTKIASPMLSFEKQVPAETTPSSASLGSEYDTGPIPLTAANLDVPTGWHPQGSVGASTSLASAYTPTATPSGPESHSVMQLLLAYRYPELGARLGISDKFMKRFLPEVIDGMAKLPGGAQMLFDMASTPEQAALAQEKMDIDRLKAEGQITNAAETYALRRSFFNLAIAKENFYENVKWPNDEADKAAEQGTREATLALRQKMFNYLTTVNANTAQQKALAYAEKQLEITTQGVKSLKAAFMGAISRGGTTTANFQAMMKDQKLPEGMSPPPAGTQTVSAAYLITLVNSAIKERNDALQNFKTIWLQIAKEQKVPTDFQNTVIESILGGMFSPEAADDENTTKTDGGTGGTGGGAGGTGTLDFQGLNQINQ